MGGGRARRREAPDAPLRRRRRVPRALKTKRWEAPALAVLLAAAAWLLLGGLGERPLWRDEAETALLGQTVLRTGHPDAHVDGLRLEDSVAPIHWNSYGIWTWHPWLQHYLAALGQRLFGPGPFGARILFALLGLLTVAATWRLGRTWLGPGGGLCGAALLLSSSPFCVYARECRWYAPAMLAMVLLADRTLALLAAPTRRRSIELGLALAALFHSNYHSLLGALPALALAAWSSRDRAARRGLALALGVSALLTLPWLWYASPNPASWFAATLASRLRDWKAPFYFLIQFNHFVFPLALALLAVALRVGGRRVEGTRAGWAFAAGVPLALLALTVLSPQRWFRYLVPGLPLAALAQAAVVVTVWRARAAGGAVLTAALLLTQVFQNAPYVVWFRAAESRALLPPVADILRERLAPRPRASECVVRFFQKNARPGETVLLEGDGFIFRYGAGLEPSNVVLTGPVAADWIIERSDLWEPDAQRVLRPGRGPWRTYSVLCPASLPHADAPEPLVHDYGWDAPDLKEVLIHRAERSDAIGPSRP